MSDHNPHFVRTEEFDELERQAEEQRRKLLEKGHANEAEKAEERRILRGAKNVEDISTVMPEVISVFGKLAQKEAAHRETLMPQIRAAVQAIKCDMHGEGQRQIDIDATCNESRLNGRFTLIYAQCPQCRGEIAEARKRNYWRRMGVEERNIDATFEAWEARGAHEQEKFATREKVRRWCKNRGNFLLLIGSSGTGKGFLATACLKWQGSGIFVKHVDMLSDLRASYKTGTTEELVTKWQDCEMLVLDEFGLSPGGRDEEPLLYQVIAYRYDQRRPMIITSNLGDEELRNALGARLLDRIRAGLVKIPMNWESYRTNK